MPSWDDPVTGFPASSEADLGPYDPATEPDATTADLVRIWWCALARQAIWPDDYNRPDCGPAMQCTGGRRQSLACGWYDLVPLEEPEDQEVTSP